MQAGLATMADTRDPQAPAAPESDEALMLRLQARRESGAFELLAQRQGAFAYRVAVAHCGKAALAEEIVQEVFLRIAQGRCHFDDQGEGSFRGWFYQLVVNLARDISRSERRTSMRPQSARYLEQSRAAQQGLAADGAGEQAEAVRAALCELSEDLRLPLVLHFIQNLSQSEVSRLLKVSQPQVSRRITEGLELLRRRMAASGAALPALAVPGLLRMEGLLTAPPELLRSLGRIPLDHAAGLAGQEASRRLVTQGLGYGSKKLVLAAVAACAVLGTGAGWWLLHPRPQAPAGAPAVSPAADPAPPSPGVLGAWNFDAGPAANLRVFQSRWSWKQMPPGGGYMVVPKGSNTGIQFPVAFAGQPIHVIAQGSILESGRASIDPFWSRDECLLMPEQAWGRTKGVVPSRNEAALLRYDLYLFDRYAICLIEGYVTTVRDYGTVRQGDRICLLIENMLIKRIEFRSIAPAEIPKHLRDPMSLREGMEVRKPHVLPRIPFNMIPKPQDEPEAK